MQKMTNSALAEALNSLLGERIVTSEELYDALVVEVSSADAFSVIETLKLDPKFSTWIFRVMYTTNQGEKIER